ncbi:MAG TPA: CocE/NonD family hydrolase [Anaerolineae bacterium]
MGVQLSNQKYLWDVKVPMRDGANLSANVFFPAGDGPFPVLLNRTPYIKDTALRTKRVAEYTKAGYAVVHMDVRGRGNSEDVFNPYFQEIEDGHDSIEWCGTQSWSTGKVGTYGGSYEGWTQIYPTRLQSKYHTAAFLICTPSMHPFREGIYWSGVPMPIMGMWTLFTSGKTNKEQIAELDWESVVNVRPLKDLMTRIGLPSSYRDEHYRHDRLDDYYKRLWYEGVLNQTIIPCYHVTGWFDDDQRGTLDHFPALALNHPDPNVRRNQKLLIGPWPHRLSTDSSKLGDFDYGAHSMVPLTKEAIRWFDFWLKGIDNGITREPRCRLFLMGADANRWIETDTFPIAESKPRVFLLGANGPANSLLGKGTLGDARGASAASALTFNPERPAPTPFWKENFQNGTNEDLRPIQRRDDVLVFTTEPLAAPLNIVGMLSAELYVSTSATDTDFVARLSDVAPDGYAQRLNAGIVRLRYRDGYEQPKLVKPGEIVQVTIDLWATGHQFKAGHRVRLEVTSSAFPTWAPNFNTGGNVWEETTPIIAENTVHHSAQYPSRLILPELPEPKFVDAWAESRWA